MEAIGLNPIRLDAIGIDPIRLNAIRLGVLGASSGFSGHPYIDPEVLASLVAVVKCDGKSNNDPDRAIIKNLVDPDNPFVISNAAYKLNSGYGKYEVDFTTWIKQSGVSSKPNKFTIISNDISYTNNYISWSTANLGDVPKFKIKISGIKDGVTVAYKYYKDNVNLVTSGIRMNKDGIYDLPYSYSIGKSQGFTVSNGKDPRIIGITIEQIPSFQGALITDGVNDLITSTKSVQEMLGGSNEITVVSMIHQIEANVNNLTNTNNIRVGSSFIRNSVVNVGKTGIYGYTFKNTVSLINNILGDKNDYTAQGDLTGTSAKFSVEGMIEGSTISQTSQVAWYWNFISKKSLTTDQINQVIAYYNLDKYVKPDIYYDVKRQGLSNNTPDADWYLKDFSDNGRDMQLYNYGKTPESGINEEGGLQSDGITDYGKAENLPIYKDYTVVADREWASSDPRSMILASKTNGVDNGAFLFEDFEASAVNIAYSFDTATSVPIDKNRIISYQSKYLYNKTSIGIGKALDGNVLCLCRGRDLYPFYANAAIWSFLLFPYTLSEFLLERQLKRYKLGTLYPDMVEFRPIVNVNIGKTYNVFHIKEINTGELLYYYINGSIPYNKIGTYLPKGTNIQILVKWDNNRADVTQIKFNGREYELNRTSDNSYYINVTLDKSPQKIDIYANEYIRYEDIVQPYPFIFPIVDTNNKVYSWGDKVKVGTEIKFAYGSNLLPQLYELRGEVMFNGNAFDEDSKHIIGKTNIFTLTEAPKYLKDNEPNCILAPQILRIPNASYKILGYIPDLTGKGNHGKINNSAYAGMSGANGYSEDFTSWLHQTEGTLTDSKFKATGVASTRWVLYKGANYNFPTNTYIATGIPNNVTLTYNNGTNVVIIENRVPFTISAYSASSATGFVLSKGVGLDLTGLIIEQIGKYEGSFCLDGIEDFLTIPTLSHGAKQILMKVNWQTDNTLAYDQRVTSGYPYYFAIYTSNEGSTIAYNPRNTNGKTYIDGVLNSAIFASQLKGITHNITITNNDATEDRTTSPVIGSGVYHNGFFTKMALFTFMSFDEISSEDEIKELNDIVGIEGGYVESPDYYFDSFGKSNVLADDIDNAIKNINDSRIYLFDKSITGLAAIEQTNADGAIGRIMDRTLQAYNFAFNEESGYGGWLGIGDLTKSFNESYVTN